MKHAALLALLTLALVACKGQDAQTDTSATKGTSQDAGSKTSDSASSAPATTTPAATTPAKTTAAVKPAGVPAGYTRVADLSSAPVRSFKSVPSYQLEDGKDYYAVIDTTKGQVLIDLLEQQTPTTVNSFVWLARHKFYDGTRFHRVIDGFMAQTGDPSSTDLAKQAVWGQGGPGYTIPLETRQSLNFDEAGVLGMARSADPNSGGSQFFVTLAAASFLDGQYTVFGKVAKGQDVMNKLTKTATSGQGGETPIKDAVADQITDLYIVTKN